LILYLIKREEVGFIKRCDALLGLISWLIMKHSQKEEKNYKNYKT